MKKKVLSWLSLSFCMSLLLLLCACQPKAAEREEKIVVAGEATTPGWIQQDDKGNLSGYDFDVWQEIGKRLNTKIEYKVMEWDGLWAMLDEGRIDTVGEQISSTPERNEKYLLSEPYAYNRYSLLCADDNKNLQSLNDLKDGMTISCESNTSDELVVNALEQKYGVKLKKTYYDGMSVLDVSMGRCDLWPRAHTSSVRTVKETKNLRILGDTDILETNVYPFAKNERGEKLKKEVSNVLAEMKKDGTLKKLSEKWFEQDISVKPENAHELSEYNKY